MYGDTVECPYCKHENDMSDALSDGVPSDNKFDYECEKCEKEFEVYVEFEPSYSASEIVFESCQKCGTETRKACTKGRIFPWPEVSETVLCRKCFHTALDEEYANSAERT